MFLIKNKEKNKLYNLFIFSPQEIKAKEYHYPIKVPSIIFTHTQPHQSFHSRTNNYS